MGKTYENDHFQFSVSYICFVCVKETSQGDVYFTHTLFFLYILGLNCPGD